MTEQAMSTVIKFFRNPDVIAFCLLLALPLVFFYPVTLGKQIWYRDDLLLMWIPFGTELGKALREGRLPLWVPGMANGFPLFAEGQIGSLYPVNLFLFRFLPAYFAISVQDLLHFIWASWGMYGAARTYCIHIAGSLLAASVFAFNGFILAHIIHPAFLTALSWLPWLISLLAKFQSAHRDNQPSLRWFVLLTFSIALQSLAGSPHVVLLSLIIFGAFMAYGSISRNKITGRHVWQVDWRSLIGISLALILGLGIAAVQLVPTLELTQYSERTGSMGYTFRIVSSLPITAFSKLLTPFSLELPDVTNNEYWLYIGFVPLILSVMAIFVRRDRWTLFLLLFSMVGLGLAVGDANPLFPWISALPGLNYFRVPARYMLFFIFNSAFLSATTFDILSHRLSVARLPRGLIPLLIGVWGGAIVLVAGIVHDQSLDFWREVWEYLPWVFGLIAVVLILLACLRRIERRIFQTLVIGLTLFDLACFTAPFLHGLDMLATPDYALAKPRALSVLESSDTFYRVFTDEANLPLFPSIRNALFPNIALLYDTVSANGYTPLLYDGVHGYLLNLSSAMLNLFNARYSFIPMDPRPPDGLGMPRPSVRLDIIEHDVGISPTLASGVHITSFTQQAADLPDGTLIAQVVIRLVDGREHTLPLRVGLETADWDYDRKESTQTILHSRGKIAYSFPSFWRSYARNFTGYAYDAQIDFPPSQVVGVSILTTEPDVLLTIVDVSLIGGNQQKISLAKLTGKDEFALRFMSDTVAVWENFDYLPRAFIVHQAESFTKRREFYRILEPTFDPTRVVTLDGGPALSDSSDFLSLEDTVEIVEYKPNSVKLLAQTNRTGYLVLLDSWYPGWNAMVNGQAVPVYRADFLFRAISLEPGKHQVVMEYRPMSFEIGVIVSVACLLITFGISVYYFRRRNSTARLLDASG